ncbi:HEPN domain-containing protein [Desulfothermus naphthae]
MQEEVKARLRFAEDDLKLAKLAYKERIYHLSCFHAQQCVEKSIKALFYFYDEVPPRTHSIAKLISLLPAEHPFVNKDIFLKFDIYYIPTRYPDTLPGMLPEGLPGREDSEEAIKLAEALFNKILEFIGL